MKSNEFRRIGEKGVPCSSKTGDRRKKKRNGIRAAGGGWDRRRRWGGGGRGEGGLSIGKVADGWVDCSVPIHRDVGWRGRQLIEGGGKEKEREKKYVSVFPHWWYIRCKIRRVTTRARRAVYADAPCKLSRTVSNSTARYVIRPRMPNSLHDGALPVVVLFASAWPVYAVCCISMREAEGRRKSLSLSLSLSSFSFFLFSHLLLTSSFFLFGGAPCSWSHLFPSCIYHYDLKQGKERVYECISHAI